MVSERTMWHSEELDWRRGARRGSVWLTSGRGVGKVGDVLRQCIGSFAFGHAGWGWCVGLAKVERCVGVVRLGYGRRARREDFLRECCERCSVGAAGLWGVGFCVRSVIAR